MTHPEDPAPLESPVATDHLGRPVYLRKQPLWTHFLTPAAVLVGALVIAGAVWLTDDDEDDPALVAAEPGAAAASTVAAGAAPQAQRGLLDTFSGYAETLGLDTGQFTQCLGQQSNVTRLNADVQLGNTFGVTGTPTFFINNKRLVGSQPAAILDEIVKKELGANPPAAVTEYSAAVQALAASNPPNFSIVERGPDVRGAQFEGNPDAKVVIAEFSDFQCPFCKRWVESSLAGLRERLGDDVALAFVHFPITQIHPNAGNASVVAMCAGEQGQFWPMHDLLFARQAEWQDLQ